MLTHKASIPAKLNPSPTVARRLFTTPLRTNLAYGTLSHTHTTRTHTHTQTETLADAQTHIHALMHPSIYLYVNIHTSTHQHAHTHAQTHTHTHTHTHKRTKSYLPPFHAASSTHLHNKSFNLTEILTSAPFGASRRRPALLGLLQPGFKSGTLSPTDLERSGTDSQIEGILQGIMSFTSETPRASVYK